jgi:hypothetical protein
MVWSYRSEGYSTQPSWTDSRPRPGAQSGLFAELLHISPTDAGGKGDTRGSSSAPHRWKIFHGLLLATYPIFPSMPWMETLALFFFFLLFILFCFCFCLFVCFVIHMCIQGLGHLRLSLFLLLLSAQRPQTGVNLGMASAIPNAGNPELKIPNLQEMLHLT